MRSLIFIFSFLAVQAMAMVRKIPLERIERTCDTPPPSAGMLEVHRKMSLQPRATPKESIEVATYFHVVSSLERKTWVDRTMIAKQVCNFAMDIQYHLLIGSRFAP